MSKRRAVAVLLSTYNGESYINELIDSIINQTYTDFILLIRDDGSSDSTVSIIQHHQQSNAKIRVIEGDINYGPKNSFGALLSYALKFSNVQYFMFADQDDVWLPDKIEMTLETMMKYESNYGKLPILIHTDLKVADQNLFVLSESFWKFQRLDPKKDELNRLLTQNIITGCTVLINRSLAQVCLPIPNEAIMHDWWIGLVAACVGKIGYYGDATILYRQHGNNNIGAYKYSFKYWIKRVARPVNLDKNIQQALMLLEMYDSRLNSEQRSVIKAFTELTNSTYIKKIGIIIKYRFFKIGLVRNIGLLLKLR